MSNIAKLTLQMTDTGIEKIGTDLKSVATEATKANTGLKTTASTVDQVSKSTTSLGSKLANAGKQFSGTITNVAALGSTVVNLSRQYQDLSDSQIRVDRSGLKVSKTTEAVGKAQQKLDALLAKGIKSGAEYEAAQLDIKQALEAQDLATRNLTEAQEDHQRAQENFWMGLAPTILTAGSSVTSMLKEMGGTNGLGGLTSKLKGLPSSLGMSTKAFAGMAGAIGLASVALVELFSQLKRGDNIKALQMLNEGPGRTSGSIQAEIAALKEQKASWGQQLKDFMLSGPIGKQIGGDSGAHIIDEVVKSLESKESRDKLIAGLKTTLANVMATPMDPSVKAGVVTQIKTIMAMYANDSNWSAGYGATAEAVSKNTQKVIRDGFQKAIDAIANSPDVGAGLTGALRTLYDKIGNYPGTTFIGQTAKAQANPLLVNIIPSNDALNKAYAKFKTDSDAALRAQFDKQPALDEDWFLGSFAQSSEEFQKGFDDAAKASADAAQKIKADQAAAAAAVKAAWDQSFAAQTSGIEKMIAAYDKLHPKEKGFSGLAQEKQFKDAQTQLNNLMAGAITKTPGYAKDFVISFVTNAAKNMTPIAGQVFQPIIDFINTHKNDAPDVFMKGLQEVLGNSSPTLASTMAGVFDKGMVQPSGEASTKAAGAISTGLGKVDVTPLEDKLKLGAQAAGLITKGINKIPKKVNTTVNITANLAQANAKWQAFARKVQMTTLQVRIAGTSVNIGRGSQAGAYGGPHAGGFSGTVRRPTMMMVGEGGREEDISITPRGSSGHSGSNSSGGGDVYVGPIYIGEDQVVGQMRYKINQNRGVVK